MTSDLIRLATELDECGGMHRPTSLINCAVKRCMEHERGGEGVGAGRSWSCHCPAAPGEDCPLTSEQCFFRALQLSSGRPTERVAEECGVGMSDKASGGICAGFAVRGAPTAFNPAPIRAERGERLPLPANGVTDPTVLAQHTEMVRAIARSADCQDERPRGISHDTASKIAADFGAAQSDFGRRLVPRYMPPVDPTIAAEDPA